jgi:UDP-glucose 4-epimerase
LEEGADVLVADDFSNSREDVMDRIAKIAGGRPRLVKVDVCNYPALVQSVESVRITGVIHLAGLKSVGESVRDPLRYYRANLVGTMNVREAAGDCPFVFSSSATVYGQPTSCPIAEDADTRPVNPYGFSKLASERCLIDASVATSSPLAILRYFNPVGAHSSGLIGDDPHGMPQNLMPVIEQVAVGHLPELTIHGTDYPTRDGTAVRDYVHVEDLADAHILALYTNRTSINPLVVNLGSERGYSVHEVINAFELATGRTVCHRVGPRRPGDTSELWASAQLAKAVLKWEARRPLTQMCEDSLRWREHWCCHIKRTPFERGESPLKRTLEAA